MGVKNEIFYFNTQFIIFLSEVYKQTNHVKDDDIILSYLKK